MSEARISCTNQQLVAGGFTVVVGVAVTAMIARLFKERVGTVKAVGVSASLLAGSVVAMCAAPQEEVDPGPPPPPPPFPTEKGQLRAWINAQEGPLIFAFQAVTESDARKAEVIGWMEEKERRDLLKGLGGWSPILKEYFSTGHEADLLAWVKARHEWNVVDEVGRLGSEMIKVVVMAERTVNGLTLEQVAKLVGRLGAEAPEVAREVPGESERLIEKSAVKAYCQAPGTDVSEHWKDKDLRDDVLKGLFLRDSQEGINYQGMLKDLDDAALRLVLGMDDRLRAPPIEFCYALREILKTRTALQDDLRQERSDVACAQRFILKHLPGWFTLKECLGFMRFKTVSNAGFAAVCRQAPFDELLKGLDHNDRTKFLYWAVSSSHRDSIPDAYRDALVAAVEEALK